VFVENEREKARDDADADFALPRLNFIDDAQQKKRVVAI
jgi:hypothetical protein